VIKTILAGFGVLFLILIVVAAAGFGYFAYTGTQLDASSKAYVDESVPAIISTWSKDELTKRASPQLRHESSDDQIATFFSSLSDKLGAFKSYDGAKGQSYHFMSTNGTTVTADYLAEATFQNARVEVKIDLTRTDQAWKILGFHVDVKAP
jgi:hypothetical protein